MTNHESVQNTLMIRFNKIEILPNNGLVFNWNRRVNLTFHGQ